MKKIIALFALLLIAALVFTACGTVGDASDEVPDRFVKVYNQHGNAWNHSTVYMDMETGVLYYLQKDGYGAGLTVLYNADGTVMTGK